MTIGLTYNDDLARVQIALSSINALAVKVERSTNQLLWETVRGGTKLPVSGGAASLDDYEFASDHQNFYRISPADITAALSLPKTSGSYASTPNHVGMSISADIDIRVEAKASSWMSGTQAIIAKYETIGNQRSWRLAINSSGQVLFTWSPNGSTVLSATSTAAVPASAGERIAIRVVLDVNNGASGRDIMFFTSDRIDGNWTQLGNIVTQAGTTSIFVGSASVTLGAERNGGTTSLFGGMIYAAEVRNGIWGANVTNPDFRNMDPGTTSFMDSASRFWTVHNTAQIVSVEEAPVESNSITPSLGDQIWLKSIKYPFLNQTIEFQDISDIEMPGRATVNRISGRSFPSGTVDTGAGMQMVLVFNTEEAADVRKLMLSLAVGNVFFLHIPPNLHPSLPHRSFYFIRTDTRIERWLNDERRLQHVQVVEQAAPGPHVVGTTLTWGTVFNLYGGWNQLINANPSWADLLQTVGSPEDLVVL